MAKNNKILKQDMKNLGGSMRLGSYESILVKNTLIEKIYKKLKSTKDTVIDMR